MLVVKVLFDVLQDLTVVGHDELVCIQYVFGGLLFITSDCVIEVIIRQFQETLDSIFNVVG